MAQEVFLKVKLLGKEQLDRKLARIQTSLGDLHPVWERVRKWYAQQVLDQFASQGRGQWVPLAASTQRDRQRHGFNPSRPILVRTGRMFASFFGGYGHIDVETPNSLEIGSGYKVASGRWTLPVLHATGTQHMPERAPIGEVIRSGLPKLWTSEKSSLRAVFSEYIHEVVVAKAG